MPEQKPKLSPIVLVKPDGEKLTTANEVFVELRELKVGDLSELPEGWGLMDAQTEEPISLPKTREERLELLGKVREETSCPACGIMCWTCMGCGTGNGQSIGKKLEPEATL
jgi:hypothetical protein